MSMNEPKNLVLILARQFASNLATPMFIVGPDGTLMYYNEAAEKILGKTFAETGELTQGEWGAMWAPTDSDGNAIATEDLPLSIALVQHKASHLPMRITGLDGEQRDIGVTAFPMFAREDEFVGAVAIFWEEAE